MPVSLVSGGMGFVGSHLVDKLMSFGHEVIILDNLSSGKESNVVACTDFFPNDINNNLDFLFGKYKFDYVFHLAAFIDLRKSIINPKECYNINVLGSINLINYCIKHNVKKFIFSSTGGAIYSPAAELPWNELSLAQPASPYGLSKLAVEQYLKMAKELYKLNYTVLRYANVYGSRQSGSKESGIIAICIEKMLNGQRLIINGNGEQVRDFIDVKSVINANILAMEKLSGTYNVSSGAETSINKIISIVNNHGHLDIEYRDPIAGEIFRTNLDSSLLRSFGWSPDSDIASGINKIIENYNN
jgi:UDP-glucose 4-epimerase